MGFIKANLDVLCNGWRTWGTPKAYFVSS